MLLAARTQPTAWKGGVGIWELCSRPAENWKLLGHAEMHLEFGPRPEGGVGMSAYFFIAHVGISNRVPGRMYSRGEKVELPHSPCIDETGV